MDGTRATLGMTLRPLPGFSITPSLTPLPIMLKESGSTLDNTFTNQPTTTTSASLLMQGLRLSSSPPAARTVFRTRTLLWLLPVSALCTCRAVSGSTCKQRHGRPPQRSRTVIRSRAGRQGSQYGSSAGSSSTSATAPNLRQRCWSARCGITIVPGLRRCFSTVFRPLATIA